MLSAKFTKSIIAVSSLCLFLAACGDDEAKNASATSASAETSAVKTLKIGVCPGPYGQMLNDAFAPYLTKQGYKIDIVEFTDYVQPDQALDSGELDANLMQHQAYLDSIVANQGLKITAVINVPTLGMGVFSDKVTSFDELADGAKVGIPTDAVNLARALRMARNIGLITLNDAGKDENKVSVGDIGENPHNLEFVLMEAAQISRSLDSVDLGFVPGNYAIAAKLDYQKALASEDVQESIKNVVAVQNDKVDTIGKLLKDTVESAEFRQAIENNHYYDSFSRPVWWDANK